MRGFKEMLMPHLYPNWYYDARVVKIVQKMPFYMAFSQKTCHYQETAATA